MVDIQTCFFLIPDCAELARQCLCSFWIACQRGDKKWRHCLNVIPGERGGKSNRKRTGEVGDEDIEVKSKHIKM